MIIIYKNKKELIIVNSFYTFVVKWEWIVFTLTIASSKYVIVYIANAEKYCLMNGITLFTIFLEAA